jgi:hypothetical protein
MPRSAGKMPTLPEKKILPRRGSGNNQNGLKCWAIIAAETSREIILSQHERLGRPRSGVLAYR